MFCYKCGKEIRSDAKFCNYCGVKTYFYEEEKNVDNMKYCNECGIYSDGEYRKNCEEKSITDGNTSDSPIQQFYTPKKKLGKKLVFPIVGLVVAIIVVFIISGNSYKGVVRRFFSAIENNNPKQMLAIAPEYWKDYQYADSTWTEEELIEEMSDLIDDYYDKFNCGENIKIKYEIREEYKPTKEEIEELEKNMYSWYAYYVYDRDEFKVTDARLLYINVHIEGESGKKSFCYPDGLLVFKENGRWKFLFGSVDTSWFRQ